ncbi:MAG: YMGG-like glycine zipper-containing protein [Planctomycetota bacterium]
MTSLVTSLFSSATRFACVPFLAVAVLLPPAEAQQYVYQPGPSYYQNDKATGTVSGGLLGAVAGAVIGGRDNAGEGALIGAGIGAITGRALGAKQDAADQARAANGYAYTADANARATQLAVTNLDLIQMTQAGLGEDVIVGAIQNRGGRFDLSPQGLITLKQNGVSDRVVATAQRLSTSEGLPPTQVIHDGPPPVHRSSVHRSSVVVVRQPAFRFHYGPRPRRGRHYHIRF